MDKSQVLKTFHDTAIVTSFIDIGRKEFTHGFDRPVEIYIEYFKNLSILKNNFYIQVDDELKEKILSLRDYDKTYFIDCNIFEEKKDLLEKIKITQQNQYYKNMIKDHLKHHPEYWNSYYVFVTILKSFFVKKAIEQYNIKEDLITWIDFGYARKEIKNIEKIILPFEKNKITMFNRKLIKNINLHDAIFFNDVFIMGGSVTASKENWLILYDLCMESINNLLDKNIIDDDQTIFLMAYLKNPDIFNLIESQDWFPIFNYCQ